MPPGPNAAAHHEEDRSMVTREDGHGQIATIRPLVDIGTRPRRRRNRQITVWRAPGIAVLMVAGEHDRASGDDTQAARREVSAAEP